MLQDACFGGSGGGEGSGIWVASYPVSWWAGKERAQNPLFAHALNSQKSADNALSVPCLSVARERHLPGDELCLTPQWHICHSYFTPLTHSKLKEFLDEKCSCVCCFACTTCREKIHLKATIHVKLKNINFTRQGTPKAKIGHGVDMTSPVCGDIENNRWLFWG